jgi:transcriptional regulator of arginine metabolism
MRQEAVLEMRHLRSGEETHQARRQAIQRLLTGTAVATQDELRRRLAKQGFVTTQTTLSRDLARLGARRVSRPGGGTAYSLDGLPGHLHPARELRELILQVDHNRGLVVVLTRPGAASAIARALDEQRLAEMLGTLAGDDTIFIAPALKVSTRRLRDAVNHLFGREA